MSISSSAIASSASSDNGFYMCDFDIGFVPTEHFTDDEITRARFEVSEKFNYALRQLTDVKKMFNKDMHDVQALDRTTQLYKLAALYYQLALEECETHFGFTGYNSDLPPVKFTREDYENVGVDVASIIALPRRDPVVSW